MLEAENASQWTKENWSWVEKYSKTEYRSEAIVDIDLQQALSTPKLMCNAQYYSFYTVVCNCLLYTSRCV